MSATPIVEMSSRLAELEKRNRELESQVTSLTSKLDKISTIVSVEGKSLPDSKQQQSLVSCINQIMKIQQVEEKSLAERHTIFPIQDPSSYTFYKKQQISLWVADELDFTNDIKDYLELKRTNPAKARLLDFILIFFSMGDSSISQNLVFRFLLETTTYEQMMMFVSQLYIEMIHAETYGLMISSFFSDDRELQEMTAEAEKSPFLRAKMLYMEKYMLADTPKVERLLAFAAAEGIFFPVLFAFIFWFRADAKFATFIAANELIARDETLHRDYGCHLHKQLKGCNRTKAIEIVHEAVLIEDQFIDMMLPKPIENLSATDMKTYARVVADNLLVEAGYEVHYKAVVPGAFTWMNDISLSQKGNFYEVKIGNYTAKKLADVLNWQKRTGRDKTKGADVFADTRNVDF